MLGLGVIADLGWIVTYGSHQQTTVLNGIVSEVGSGRPVSELWIEVDNVDAAMETMRAAGFRIEHGPVDEAWGVRRFYVRDPLGTFVNILARSDGGP